ncbi:LysR family transcriptional regulator [Salinicola endophyticus]|uniref:LysR family transcriptional regulator n=1 Tax=Salinicola endophyticus TaxID=1949083 RepID=A0AB74U461_9GAMM
MSQRRITLMGQLGDVDLRLLRIFRKVVECGGFSSAEVELNISRAAISMAMSDLETRLSMRLCQRGRSGFRLTSEGHDVYEATVQLLAAVEDFRTRVNGLHSRLTGELNIGITDNLVTLPDMQVTEALRALKARGDNVHINIRMAPPNDIEMAVLGGSLHAGVVPELKRVPGLDYLTLYEEQSALYCSDRHPLFACQAPSVDQIAGHDAVVPSYAQTPEIKRVHEALKPMASATDREGVAFLVLTGSYIGFLPTHYAQRWRDQGRMRRLAPDTFEYATRYEYSTRYYAITRKGRPPNLVLESFLEELEACLVQTRGEC